ncbi:hypothetical protein [uncultured Bacteroides sp.]|uniref:hypothetical protein n=1 Tax=uncultured Bacteroides sp. TaxID=162156 RepID=UPI0025F06285|nr:hypothetical protein [uncultured Bacteroides sp.]
MEWKIAEQIHLQHVDLFSENTPLTEDIETLTAKQLIAYIESVFRQSDTCPWLKDIAFDTFCEYLLLYRMAGIPAALDMLPAWGNCDGNHAWAQPIDARFHSREAIEEFKREIPKVYRQTYSRQKDITPKQGEFIPPFFRDAFLKDVTDEYVNTATVTEKDFPGNVRYGYLCVFNEQQWKPVAQADIHKGTCTFARLGTNCLYLPVYYENGLPVPVAAPFVLKSNGDKQRIDKGSQTTELTLYRKYPLEHRKENLLVELN